MHISPTWVTVVNEIDRKTLIPVRAVRLIAGRRTIFALCKATFFDTAH
jgi:hypothetical protein